MWFIPMGYISVLRFENIVIDLYFFHFELIDVFLSLVPQTSTVAPCRVESSFRTEAVVISTSVLTGVLFPTVIVLCLILVYVFSITIKL